ncbi:MULTISPECIES: type II secretion system minor pseudopilin GspH [unclassified Pseudomonas]|uniref:type II secretion system minor pseudopilin GspH n=1 Tax=unclassified Pseudomonas TaxID=196821 RepID=UPI00119AE11B|nr:MULTISPECIES: type II secretion system minor pseudopilin GspH [unclassified Pseudomonas]TWC10535.1 general secretion pathway protein H [Pseudomonas sp. SJZ075]TWC26690.1 general secretion pathway protein H [Pseudomonas sp. SJZ078]TWC45853.1 general secretion pathway protein H [Pseudomonas sp. SJZ124]TWC46118.1 general secretion pathway protein H [Pseudomonas sp. SJZ080]TWC81132.1 general secretion pathway protein H [Pseudomonas sp. SJZ101]
MYRHCRGFTLLELMVVIVLIGVLLGTVGLAIGKDSARQARQQAQDFIRVVQQLREQAVLDGQEYGLRMQSGAYQALRLEALDWVPAATLHQLPEDLKFELEVDRHVLKLNDAPGSPQLLLLSSDEISPFRLFIHAGGKTLARVFSDGLAEPLIDE